MFKQKTAYEMRISDWSSDVCSSDLHVYKMDGSMEEVHNPADMPDPMLIDHIDEPWIRATIMVPDEHLGSILKLCEEKRGRQVEQIGRATCRARVCQYV